MIFNPINKNTLKIKTRKAIEYPPPIRFHQNRPRAPSVPPVCCVRAAGVTLLQATCPSRARTCKELSDWSTGRGKVRLHTLSGSHKARLADPTDYNRARDLRIPTLLLRLADCSDLSLSTSDAHIHSRSFTTQCSGILCLHFVIAFIFTNMPSEKTVTKCSETRRVG